MKISVKIIGVLTILISIISCENDDFAANNDIKYIKKISNSAKITHFSYDNRGRISDISIEEANVFSQYVINYQDGKIDYIENDVIYDDKAKTIIIEFNRSDNSLHSIKDSKRKIFNTIFETDNEGRISKAHVDNEKPPVDYLYDECNNIVYIKASPTKTSYYGEFCYDNKNNAFAALPYEVRFFLKYSVGDNNIISNNKGNYGYNAEYTYNEFNYPVQSVKTIYQSDGSSLKHGVADTTTYEYY